MIIFGIVLNALLAALVFLFWRRARGRPLDDLVAGQADAHEHVHRVLAKHPHGGTWRQFVRWMEDET